MELVDDPVPPGLDVEEPAVGRGCGIDRPRIGGRGAEQVELPARALAVPALRTAPGVGGIQIALGLSDPARRRLAGGDGIDHVDRSVGEEVEGGQGVGSGLGHHQVTGAIEGDGEGNRTGFSVHHRVWREITAGSDTEHVDVAAVGLGRHDQLGPVGREGHLTGGVRVLGRGRRVQPERPGGTGYREETTEAGVVPLDRAAVLGVEDVDQIAAHGHADRECPARAHHLAEAEVIADDGEDRDGITAGIHGIQ